MSLRRTIEKLEEIVKEVLQEALSDDKTPLGNSLGLQDLFRLTNIRKDFSAIIFADLNRFKSINDIYGHKVGDSAITQAGLKIKELLVDKCQAEAFRQSGDEFVILLPASNLNTFKKLSKQFADISFSLDGKLIKTAMSFGFVLIDDKTDFDILLERAELACLQAKLKGDGKIVQWTEELRKESFINFRTNCDNCGTKMRVDVPQNQKPTKLSFCAFCGSKL